MSTSLNARHRRHVERARKQGRADGPATLAAMAKVYTAAAVVSLERKPCDHPAGMVVVTDLGWHQCIECGETL